MRVHYTCFSLLLHAPTCAGIPAFQSIPVTGNDAGYSPPSSVNHGGLYDSCSRKYIDC